MNRPNAIRWLKAISYLGIYGGLLMPLMFIPIVIFPFVFSKLIFFQVLIGLTFPAYLILAWVEPKYRPRLSMLYLSIIAYFIAIGLSAIFSVDPLRSWWGNQERMNGMFTLLHFLAWLSMTIGVIKTWPQWRRFLNYEIGLSVFMAGVALLQKPFPKLLMFPAGDRVGGLLDNPIYMAAYQIFNLFFIALLWMKGGNRNAKIWYAVAAVADIAAFIAAQSRGALLGLAAGIVVFAIAYGAMTTNKKAKRWVLAGVVCVFAGYGLLFAMRDVSFVRDSSLSRFTNFSGSTRTRLIAWEIAWKGFLDRPLTGWGFDTFHILFNEKYNPESLRFGYYETWFDRAHNTVLDIVSMTGLFGLVTFIAIFSALFWTVIRAHRKGWIDTPVTSILISLPVAYFVQNLFVFDHPAVFSMSFLMYALVIGATTAQFNEKPDDHPAVPPSVKPRSIPWIGFGALQIAAIVLVWVTSVMPFQASVLSIKSNNSFGSGNYELSFNQAKEAFAIWTPYLDEQTFLQSRNFISLGTTQIQKLAYWRDWHDLIVKISNKHLQEHPRNTHPHFILARFAESMIPLVPEDADIADTNYQAAIKLSPKRQQLFYSYAHFLVDRGRKAEAFETLKQVVSFDPEIGESLWLLGLHEFFDQQMVQEGAKDLVKSMTVAYPYELKEAREAMALAIAYDTLGMKDELKGIIQLLPKLPQGDLAVYVQIARVMEHQGLIQERDMILNALARLDPAIAQRLEPLTSGSVTSIQASFAETADLPPPTAPTAATTSSAGGSGPRR